MLSQLEAYSVLPAKDLKRAREFYRDKLGLEPAEEHEHGIVYRTASGARVQMYETENAGTAKNTALGWMTDDLEAEMAALRSRGVVFEEYDVPGLKTVNGIATDEDGRAAWFRDSEGNFICVSEGI